MTPKWRFTILMLAVVLAGIIIFFLAGIIKVRKGRVALIERLGNYVGTYRPGVYYLFPVIYRPVGSYPIGETKKVIKTASRKYLVSYEIDDFKLFHYVGHEDLKSLLDLALRESPSDPAASLRRRAPLIGVSFKSLEAVPEKADK